MRHVWTVICQSYLEDKASNNASLIEVLERLSFKTDVPTERRVDIPLPFQLHIVSLWARDESDDGDGKARVRLLSPEAEELFCVEHYIEFGSRDKIRVNGLMASLPYTVNGSYEFEVCCYMDGEWTPVAMIPLEILREDQD